ncbi:MAG: M3 family oligoendopeptidase [Phycisphaeraceae bacterium]|nr:MAG: M3 family oligoendopeptidase [Phycisphaeraceae bacterium]
MPTATEPFVPAEFDAAVWENVEPLWRALMDRPVESAGDLETWLLDRSELDAACSESAAMLYINMTCDTADTEAAGAYRRYIEEVAPKMKPAAFRLDRRQAELAERFGLTADRYEVMHRDTKADVDLFREENVPLQTKLETLSQDHQTVTGAMTVEFEGKTKTMPQMAVYQESTDRAVRERAWRACAERRLQDRDTIDGIFDEMVALRHKVAQNAGYETFTGYMFAAKHRFDYTPETCFAFHKGVEKEIMPLCARLDAERREKLGLDELRPWDLGVDPAGAGPLEPFAGGADLVAKTREAFDALDPQLAGMFRTLGDGSNTHGIATGELLDLDSRKGKAPGGYQYMLDRRREPFIFMNAAGLHRDVETMVHEAGHAFHSMLCNDEPLLHYRSAPLEFAEVASMSMELLTMPHWGAFYSEADTKRAKKQQLADHGVRILPWIATIDAFQHWVYANPTHTREQRTRAWRDLIERFGLRGCRVAWDETTATARDTAWHAQPHPFSVPFYYIEYGIAQLGAYQLWIMSLDKGPDAAIAAYKKAMSLGGSRPLPELFAAAGLEFDFGPSMMARLRDRVEAELDKLG